MLSKTSWGIAAGAGLCLVGYCIYFDKKRRSDPLFKKKLRERRRKAKVNSCPGSSTSTAYPNLTDPQSMQRFFLQEVQLGEEKLAVGEVPEGIEHLANAVAVCGQPQQLLQVLQQTLSPQIFKLLLDQLPVASEKLAMASPATRGPTVTPLTEEDLE